MICFTLIFLENLFCMENDFIRAFECIRMVENFCESGIDRMDTFPDSLYKYVKSSFNMVDIN